MAKDETFISERQALAVLMQQGDFTEAQARIILGHSRKTSYDGASYYPMSYIYKRAKPKKNPRKSAPRKKTIAQEHKAIIAWKKASLTALHKQLGIKKKPVKKVKSSLRSPRNIATTVRAKRNPVEHWLILAHVPARGASRSRVYYYTGTKFDSVKTFGKRYLTLGDARLEARKIMSHLPKHVEALELVRA